jgi:hypothetical protein
VQRGPDRACLVAESRCDAQDGDAALQQGQGESPSISWEFTLRRNRNSLITLCFRVAESGLKMRANPLSHKKKLPRALLDSL